MRPRPANRFLVRALACGLAVGGWAVAGAESLRYAGRLTGVDGAPMAGPVEMKVRFFRAADGGGPVGPVLTLESVALDGGGFDVGLPLAAAELETLFGDGSLPVFVEVSVGDKAYPRQRLGAVPLARRVPVDGVSLRFDTEGKLTLGDVPLASVQGLGAALAGKAASTHAHAMSDVTGLTAALAGKAPSSHGHALDDVAGLQAALDDKAAATHAHTLAGDVAGGLGTTTVQALQGRPVEATEPTEVGQVLKWNGNAWAPGPDDGGVAGAVSNGVNLGPGGAGTADVFSAVSSGNLQFRRIKAGGGVEVSQTASEVTVAVAATGCSDGHVLKRVAGAWACALDANTDAVSSVAGKTGAVTLTTSDVTEGSGLYYTNARARAAVSATAPLSYDATAGVLSWSGTTTDVGEGTNQYFTTARARAAISATAPLGYDAGTGVLSLGALDATALGSGTVDNTELGHLNGVTSPIQTQLDGKAALAHGHAIADVTGLQAALDGKAAATHAHAIADTTGLQAALDGKASATHTHGIADVTGLQTALDGKAATAHTHSAADITSGTLSLARIDATGCSNGEVLKRVAGAWACAADVDSNTTAIRGAISAAAPLTYDSGTGVVGLGTLSALAASDGTPAQALVVDADGNAGVGTTSPSGRVHVVGSAGAHSLYVQSGTGQAASTPRFEFNSGIAAPTASAWGLRMVNTNTTNGNRIRLGFITADTNGAEVAGAEIQSIFTSHAAGAVSGDLALHTTLDGTGYERMRVTSDGRVGVGMTSPSTALSVQAETQFHGIRLHNASSRVAEIVGLSPTNDSGALALYSGGNDAKKVHLAASGASYIAAGGAVGIGTTTPAFELDVHSDSAATVIGATGYGAMGVFVGRSARGTPAAPSAAQSGDELAFFGGRGYGATGFATGSTAGISMRAAQNYTDTAQGAYMSLFTTPLNAATRQERVRIDETGNVGVGTTTPKAKLDVNGTFIRQIARATANGPGDTTDSGQITSRVLSVTKQHAATDLRISWTDNRRIFPADNTNRACRWEIRVGGVSCPTQALVYDYFNGYSTDNNDHHSANLVGYCRGLAAGTHQIQIWVGPVPSHSQGDCYTGWAGSTWVLEAEEVY